VSLPAFALLFQAGAMVISPPAPTVGDTITVVRTIPVATDVRARAQPLGSSLVIEPLADPVVSRGAQGITIRYTLALFEAGRHPVGVPPVELLYRDGRVELLPGDTAWVTVRSVLPSRGDSLPPPKESLGPIARFPTRSWPLATMVGAALVITGGWGVARRRVKPPEREVNPRTTEPAAPLMRWISAGEGRAVAAVAADRLRNRIAELVPEADRALSTDECITVLETQQPDWPLRDLGDTLRGLERARFASTIPSDVALLVDQVDTLLGGLARPRSA
jgi:hypothetical protein